MFFIYSVSFMLFMYKISAFIFLFLLGCWFPIIKVPHYIKHVNYSTFSAALEVILLSNRMYSFQLCIRISWNIINYCYSRYRSLKKEQIWSKDCVFATFMKLKTWKINCRGKFNDIFKAIWVEVFPTRWQENCWTFKLFKTFLVKRIWRHSWPDIEQ